MTHDWDEVQKWRRRGENFLIEVTHYTVEVSSAFGEHDDGNRWNVHAYVYPGHALFPSLNESKDIYGYEMPLHGGPSLFEKHYNRAGEITSVQIGADYNHLGDESYSYYKTKDGAAIVFFDAETLFTWLSNVPSNKADRVPAQ